MKKESLLKKVVIKKTINAKTFLRFMPLRQRAELLRAVERIKGKRVVHINATAVGGGVAEILQSIIPYLRSLGVESDWYGISPNISKRFFNITNKFHNALQGSRVKISRNDWSKYRSISEKIAVELDRIDCDVLVINDPQPLLAGYLAHVNKHKIYINHIDTSTAQKYLWKKLIPVINSYHRIIFSNSGFVHKSISKEKVRIFTPAIDPLAAKQNLVNVKKARLFLKEFGGIPTSGPLIVQVSRFDIWKNPLGVIEAFRIIQQTFPRVQLAFVGFNEAKDNPEAFSVYRDISAIARQSFNIHLFFQPHGKRVVEFTNMAQNGADVVVQNSIKEGFGLVVTEAMWKKKPVIGGPASGIRKQIVNGKNGFIAVTPEEIANKVAYFLKNPKKRHQFGKRARKTVIKKFLFPRLVLDHLKLYISCLN